MLGFLSNPGEVRSENLGSTLPRIIQLAVKVIIFCHQSVGSEQKYATLDRSKDMRYKSEETWKTFY